MPITITDVPRLNADGSGAVELTTGDVSVPCIGVYRRGEGKAYFLWTVQQIQGVNLFRRQLRAGQLDLSV